MTELSFFGGDVFLKKNIVEIVYKNLDDKLPISLTLTLNSLYYTMSSLCC